MELNLFKDLYKGKRLFLACTGPSLNEVPMESLEHEYVMTLNRGYLKEGLNPDFLVTADKRVEAEFVDEILQVPCTVFSNRIVGPNVVNYKFKGGKFSLDAEKGVKLGHSVTVVALQLAYYMGFRQTYIIGMDHYIDYSKADSTRALHYKNKGSDINHFSDEYYGPDYEYRYQNLKSVEKSYAEAYEAFNDNGRILMNATKDSYLDGGIIPRVPLETLL